MVVQRSQWSGSGPVTPSERQVFAAGNLGVWQIGIRDNGYKELGLHVVNLDYNCSL